MSLSENTIKILDDKDKVVEQNISPELILFTAEGLVIQHQSTPLSIPLKGIVWMRL